MPFHFQNRIPRPRYLSSTSAVRFLRAKVHQFTYFVFVLSRFDISVLPVLTHMINWGAFGDRYGQASLESLYHSHSDSIFQCLGRTVIMIRDLRSVLDQSLLRASFRSWASLAVGFLFALLVFVPRSQAQVSAAISGRVIDPAGAVVSGATVTASHLETQAARTSVTDEAGRYSMLSLPVGVYEVRISKQGFQQAVRDGIHLAVGQQAIVDMTLRIGQVSEQVKVNADAPLVSVTYADISGLVAEQQVKDLPLNGRSYDELMTLNPGVVNFTWEKTGGIGVSNSTTGNMFSVAGNRPQQNLFLLNGVEDTGAAENNMQPGGTSQQLLGVDAVREFNLLRDSYGAEYGKHPGGQVSIITQSGTNQLHGSVFEYLRNNALDAANFFDQGSAPPFWRDQFGGSIGGPVQKDRTFVFANYEGFRENFHQ